MITLRTILRGVTARFAPALLVSTAALFSLFPYASVPAISLQYGLLAVGYAGTLVALRNRLRADVGVDGRRGALAGLLVPAAHIAGLVVFPTGTLGFGFTNGLIGAALALGLYFPWLMRGPVTALPPIEAQPLLEESYSERYEFKRTHQSPAEHPRRNEPLRLGVQPAV